MEDVIELMRFTDQCREKSPNKGRGTMARDSLVNIGGSLAGGAANFGAVVVLARYYGLPGTGLYFQAVALTSIVSGACLFGAPVSLMRFVARRSALDPTELPATIWAAVVPPLLLSVLAAVALFAVAGPLGSVLASAAHAHTLASLLRAFAFVIPATAVNRLSVAIARGLNRSAPGVVLDTGGLPILRLAVLLLLSAMSAPLWSLGVAWLAVGVACAVTVACWARRIAVATIGGTHMRRSSAELREFWAFAAPRGLEEVLQVTGSWILLLVVGSLGSASAAGAYAVISRSAMLGALVLQGTIFALGPRIAALFATGEHQQAQRLYRVSTTWIVAASAPVFVVLLWFPSAFLRLFSTQTAADAFAFRILIAAMLVNLAAGPVGAVLLMAGRSTWNLMNAATGLALALAIGIWTVPTYGATGAAIAWGTSIVVQNVLAVTQIWRGFGMHPFTRVQGAASLLAAAVLGAFCAALHSLMGDTPEAAALAFLVGSATYGVVLLRVVRQFGLADIVHVLRGQLGRDVVSTESWTPAAVRTSPEGGS